MIGADLVRFFIVLGMLLVRTPSMVWLVYPLLLVETIGAAFFEPAHNSVIPNIVPENQVLTANALASITWSFCLAAGASLGGMTAVLAGTRRGLRAQRVLLSGLGLADPPHDLRRTARCRSPALARS